MRKILVFITFVLALLPAVIVSAQDPLISDSGEWIYTENDTGLTLTVYLGNASDVTIPAYIGDKPVTQLGAELFMGDRDLTSVIIPDQISVFGNNMFSGCTSLQSVTMPASLKRLSPGTFRYCTALTYVQLPYNLTSIGKEAFFGCSNLREISIPPYVTSIEESAFENCRKLIRITAVRQISSVGGNAFRNTEWLDRQTDEFVFIGKGILIKWNGNGSTAQIPYGTTMISSAFDGNQNVEEVWIPASVKQIGQYAFRNAVNLKTISLPDYLTTLGGSAFEGCLSLKEIKLPDTLRTVGASAFRNCMNLRKITIPKNTASLGSLAFADCSSLTDAVFLTPTVKIDKKAFQGSGIVRIHALSGSTAHQLAEEAGIQYSLMAQKSGDFLYIKDDDGVLITRYTGSQKEVEIPSSIEGSLVTRIGAAAFQNSRSVRTVWLPSSVKVIEDRAFADMPNLEFIQIPAGIKQIGSNAFAGDLRLSQIRLPRRLTEIGEDAFDRNTGIRICAQTGSAPMQTLEEMGYSVFPYDQCAAEPAAAEEDCICGKPSYISETYGVIRLPDGLTRLSSVLLDGMGEDLILFIPASVTEIDSGILNDHGLTIIGDPGSAAEEFAEDNGIRFYVDTNIQRLAP